MKKLFALSLALICMFTGCGAVESKSEKEPVSEQSTEEAVTYSFSTEEDKKALAYLIKEYEIMAGESIPQVILDCDMTFLGDDALCMCILAQADTLGLIDLIGVTVTGGNSFVAVGTNAALCQLELIGREDIPVYMGTDEPLEGFRNLEEQAKIVGRIDKWGAMNKMDRYVAPKEYHNLDRLYDRKWGYSKGEAQEQNSVDFMIEQVMGNEGEVTIISCGAPTNIALACEKEEVFAEKTAGIIYMGGILEGDGTYTPYSDFNCFYDAKAFQVCFNSRFPSQTMIPHDVVEQVLLDKSVFDRMDGNPKTPISNLWLENQYGLYQRDPKRKESYADAIAATVFLLPSVVKATQSCAVEINADAAAPEYGKLSVSEKTDRQCVDFVVELDAERYWNFVTDLLCHVQE